MRGKEGREEEKEKEVQREGWRGKEGGAEEGRERKRQDGGRQRKTGRKKEGRRRGRKERQRRGNTRTYARTGLFLKPCGSLLPSGISSQ